jgi:hypothetical protein
VIPEPPIRYLAIEVRDVETGKGLRDENGQPVVRIVEAEWSPQALATWVEVWSSEMVEEYLNADHGLIRTLLLLEQDLADRAANGRSLSQAAEAAIKARKELGLSPMGRRSLDWVIAQTNETEARTRRAAIKAVDATCEELPPADSPELEAEELGALYE